jgi:hypothetical protein
LHEPSPTELDSKLNLEEEIFSGTIEEKETISRTTTDESMYFGLTNLPVM